MRVSVITVVFNAGDTIGDTIESVAAQTHGDLEYIVVDGGSTDATPGVIDRHRATIARVIREPDRGMYDAMNKGMALATGEVIGFLNADDIYADERVVEDVARVFERPEMDACYGDLIYTRRGDLNRTVRYWKAGPFSRGAFARGWMPPHPTFFARSRVYRQFGGFDLFYPLAADVELMVRLMEKHAVKTAYLPRVLVKMRMGGVSNRRLATVFLQNIAICRALRSNGLKCSWRFVAGKLAGRVRQLIAGRVYHET